MPTGSTSRAMLALAGLIAAAAAAPGQTNVTVSVFHYIGCVEADPSQFPVAPALGPPITAKRCQHACAETAAEHAAFGSDCRCADAAAEFVAVDEAKCSARCAAGKTGDAGHCGGPVPDGKYVFSLYRRFPLSPAPAATKTSADSCEMGKQSTAAIKGGPVSCPSDTPNCAAHGPSCVPEGCPPETPVPGCNTDCPGQTAVTHSKVPVVTPSHAPATGTPVVISKGSARPPVGRVMSLLGIGALALAAGLS